MSEIKNGKAAAALAVFALAVLLSVPPAAQTKPASVDSDSDAVILIPSQLKHRHILFLKDIPLPSATALEFNPSPPAPKKPAILGATFAHVSAVPLKMDSANVFHSADGGKTWGVSELAAAPERGRMIASLPGRSAGAKVLTALRARNEKGGTLADLACAQTSWPPSAAYFKQGCDEFAKRPFAECLADRRPRGCMFALGEEETPVDDPPSRAGEDFDILDFRMGYDAQWLYFDITVQGEISPGSLAPIALNQYAVTVMNPASAAPDPEQGLPLDGALIRLLPLGYSVSGIAPPCSVIINRDGVPTEDSSSAVCEIRDSHALFKVKRNLWPGKQPLNEFIVFAHTGVLRNKQLDHFSFVDITGLTRARLSASSYTVAK
ncbi:MAG TPA: hypothetical protein PKH33_12370 [bacterium]|nr:hypothetical protein [bacterium]